MEETIIEETNENLEEEETPIEEPQKEEMETPKEKTDSPEQYSEREKRYYARMKQAEAIAKQAREDLAKTKKPSYEGGIDAIIEVQEATRGLSTAEIEELKLRADVLRTSLSDARKNENYVLWQKAYKEKVDKENVPLPSTTQGTAPDGARNLEDMTLEERTEFFEKIGLVSNRKSSVLPPRQ